MPSNTPDPSIAIIWFVFVTVCYFIFKLNTTDQKTLQIYYSIYLLFVILGEYFINLDLTKTICGSNQWNSTLIITLFPWIIIFGTINIILNIFPGWLVPFSNTIGYGIAKLAGLGELSADLFIKPEDFKEDKDKELKMTVEKIYTDKSTFINELYYDESKGDNQTFWNNIKDIIVKQPPVGSNYESLDEMKKRFVGFLRLKDIVAESIWFIISGFLVTSISYNYLLNIGCKKTVQEMQNTSNKYNEAAKVLDKDKVKSRRLYTYE